MSSQPLPHVITVDADDQPTGVANKMVAHVRGLRHRAVSVFVFNVDGALLMQRRAVHKYHSGGLWSNTCCTHPHPGEPVHAAARRRLKEEMGISCVLSKQFTFSYRVQLGDLIENEIDHVFFGCCGDCPSPNPDEVSDWKWMHLENLKSHVDRRPNQYTYWFRLLLSDHSIKPLLK